MFILKDAVEEALSINWILLSCGLSAWEEDGLTIVAPSSLIGYSPYYYSRANEKMMTAQPSWPVTSHSLSLTMMETSFRFFLCFSWQGKLIINRLGCWGCWDNTLLGHYLQWHRITIKEGYYLGVISWRWKPLTWDTTHIGRHRAGTLHVWETTLLGQLISGASLVLDTYS